MPYSLVLERASGTHNYSVQRKVEPTHLRVLCSVPVSQAHSNKFRLAALEALCFISLWCLGAQRKGMVIIMDRKAQLSQLLVDCTRLVEYTRLGELSKTEKANKEIVRDWADRVDLALRGWTGKGAVDCYGMFCLLTQLLIRSLH